MLFELITKNIPILRGGVELLMVGIALASSAAMFFFYKDKNTNQDKMQPASLDSFGVSQASEGSVIPIVYGQCLITGNIIYYGGLRVESVYEQSAGGKGGKKKKQVVAYRYYLDIWQALCLGKVNILKTFLEDEEQSIYNDYTIENDGTESTYPTTEVGTYANKIKGVAHIFYKGMFVGENSTAVPTIKFLVESELDTGLDYENMTNGSNPAAIIKDLLLRSDASDYFDIDDTSFQEAADYWYNKDYALNIVFNSQEDVGQMVQKVLSYVDGILYIKDGKFKLKAYKENETSVAELAKEDYIEFSFDRFSYDELDNDFRGTFIDKEHLYSERVVVAKNTAIIKETGEVKQQSVDLTAFITADIASKRIFELMKKYSYPVAEINFKTNLSFSNLELGDIVSITHQDYEIDAMGFRIISISFEEIDKNEIEFKAIEDTESKIDNNYQASGGTQWTEDPAIGALEDLSKVKIFEMPYNSNTLDSPAFLILCAREAGNEVEYRVLISTGSDYYLHTVCNTYSQAGTLDETYIVTKQCDNKIGILYTHYEDDIAPSFDSIDRTDVFSGTRVAIIGSEIMAFETVTPEGEDSYRLGGIVRGIMGTPIEEHTSGETIYICNILDNYIKNLPENFNVKLIPASDYDDLDEADATAHSVTVTYKAMKPRDIALIVAERTGSTIDIQLFPSSPSIAGAGNNSESVTDKEPTFNFSGDFQISYGSVTEIKTTDYFSITEASEVNITIKHRWNGFLSSGKTIIVGSSDGIYKK